MYYAVSLIPHSFETYSIFFLIYQTLRRTSRPGSSVDITTGYCLDGPGIESRWGGARFSASVQTGPGVHSASCTMGTGSFPEEKSGWGLTLTPHPLLVPLVMKEQSYTSAPLIGRTACTEPQCLYKGCTLPYLFVEHHEYKRNFVM